MVYISKEFPFSWIENGSSIKKIGYVSVEELTHIIEQNGPTITDIDETTKNVITLFTRIAFGVSQGQKWMRKFRTNDYIIVINIERDVFCVFKVE
jgi:hypothetical protein